MSRGNPQWGTERIRGELLKLGIVPNERLQVDKSPSKPKPNGPWRWRDVLTDQVRGTIMRSELALGLERPRV